MFINENIFKHLYMLIGLLLLFVNSTAFAQGVESISNEIMKDVSADELYWVVEVTCVGLPESRSLQQRAGQSRWCAVELPQLCETSKVSLAEQVCKPEYHTLAGPDALESPNLDVTQEQEIEADQTPIAVVPETLPVVSSAEPVVVQTPVQEVVQAPALEIEPRNLVESIEIEPTDQSSNVVPVQVNSNVNNSLPATDRSLLSAEEIAIEEELIQIEQEMLELRLKEIELEQ